MDSLLSTLAKVLSARIDVFGTRLINKVAEFAIP